MSDSGHNIPGQTSEFEFKLSKAAPDTKPYPMSGTYQGWFHLKQAGPKQVLTSSLLLLSPLSQISSSHHYYHN